jgi:hypothetical protein
MPEGNSYHPMGADATTELFYGLVYALADDLGVKPHEKWRGLVRPGVGHEIQMVVYGLEFSQVHFGIEFSIRYFSDGVICHLFLCLFLLPVPRGNCVFAIKIHKRCKSITTTSKPR